MTKSTCDHCNRIVEIPDGSVITTNTIVTCNQGACEELEIRFRTVFCDQNINAGGNKGQWLKERIQWTKPANGSWNAIGLNARKWNHNGNKPGRRQKMLKEKPFTPIPQKVNCAHCGNPVLQRNALHYRSQFYCCHLCRGSAEYADRVKWTGSLARGYFLYDLTSPLTT